MTSDSENCMYEKIEIKNKEFDFHILNEVGKHKALQIANYFDCTLESIKQICPEGRELAITKTNLEQACFFAKKAMASDPKNHLVKNAL